MSELPIMCCHSWCSRKATCKVRVWVPTDDDLVKEIETFACDECAQGPGVDVIGRLVIEEPTDE